MKYNLLLLTVLLFFGGCSKEPKVMFTDMPETNLVKSDFDELPNWEEENYFMALNSFINSCKSSKTKKIYQELCTNATQTSETNSVLKNEFTLIKITTQRVK